MSTLRCVCIVAMSLQTVFHVMYAAVLCLNRTLVCIQVPHMPKAGIARMTCMTWELHKMLTCMQVLA